MSEWEQIGTFGVDSGQVLITDPCYVKDFIGDDKEDFDEAKQKEMQESGKFAYSYNGACARTLDISKDRRGAGSIGQGCDGVVANTGFGDGEYPVYAKFEEGRCKEIKIVFF
jgi:hypothetical protein